MRTNKLPGALLLLLREPWGWPSRLWLPLARTQTVVPAGVPALGASATAPVKPKRAYVPRKKPAAAAPTTGQPAPTAPKQRKRKAKANRPPPLPLPSLPSLPPTVLCLCVRSASKLSGCFLFVKIFVFATFQGAMYVQYNGTRVNITYTES
jgi:hypothetical protein